MSITAETRRESYEKVDSSTLYREIIQALSDKGKALTAREIAFILYSNQRIKIPARQAVAPRLTELSRAGVIRVTGKAFDEETGRKVALYGLVEE